ncbi:hypothetical protein [Pseudofulvibacter geojedonensis]|uniref:Uncharacterized protein n=1 Tax=Pseudofulvibacter geojedonensis TaxID=1123758 RepID=A0ABW3HZD7_9FLAO
MQKIAVFILLFSIIAKPLYVGSVYGNYFLDIDGFIEKYCVNKTKVELQCNGKCELAKQLNSSTEKNNTQEPATISPSDSFVMLFFQKNNIKPLDPTFTFIKTLQPIKNSKLLSKLINLSIDYPPEFL